MQIQDLLNAEKAPSAEAINTAIFGFLSQISAKFEKRDDSNPWRNSPAQCLQRMTIQMAEQAHRDDDIATLLRAYRLGENADLRAAYGHDCADEMDRQADTLELFAGLIADEWRANATSYAKAS